MVNTSLEFSTVTLRVTGVGRSAEVRQKFLEYIGPRSGSLVGLSRKALEQGRVRNFKLGELLWCYSLICIMAETVYSEGVRIRQIALFT